LKYEIELHPEAVIDLQEAFEWYEMQNKGLGKALVIELDKTLEKVALYPQHYQVIDFGLQATSVRKFPYRVIFKVLSLKIVVLAIFHQKRNPAKLKLRL
jgi:plasmid stabilization system protein ParE